MQISLVMSETGKKVLEKSAKECWVKSCASPSLKVFCEFHLKTPVVDCYKFSDAVDGTTPSIFYKTPQSKSEAQLTNSMAKVLQVTSPLNLKISKRTKSKIQHGLLASNKHNSKFLEVTKLEPSQKPPGSFFYAPDKLSATQEKDQDQTLVWKHTENFKSFKQKKDMHQGGHN